MFLSIPHPHYFSYKTNKEVKEIYWFTVLNGFGLALAYIFEPIYLYHLGFSLPTIMWFYVEVYTFYVALLLFVPRFASHFGLKHAILISNVLYLFYWIALFFIKSHLVFFALAPFFFALQKSFFWPAFNTYTALASSKSQRGRQVGVIYSIVELAYIAGPFIGGLVSQNFGFVALFALAGLTVILSCLPLFWTRDIRAPGGFEAKYLLQFISKNPKNFFGYWGYAEDLMQMSLWPILMYMIVHLYFGVGLITTFASLIACVVMLYIGKLADRNDKHGLIESISFFYGISWIFRFVAVDTISVSIFDTLTKIGKGLINIPIVSLTLETARVQSGKFTLMYATFFEFSLSIGKIFTALAAITILNLTGNVYLVFVLVGFLTFFYSFLTNRVNVIKAV